MDFTDGRSCITDSLQIMSIHSRTWAPIISRFPCRLLDAHISLHKKCHTVDGVHFTEIHFTALSGRHNLFRKQTNKQNNALFLYGHPHPCRLCTGSGRCLVLRCCKNLEVKKQISGTLRAVIRAKFPQREEIWNCLKNKGKLS